MVRIDLLLLQEHAIRAFFRSAVIKQKQLILFNYSKLPLEEDKVPTAPQ